MLAETPSSFFFPGYLFAFAGDRQGAWGWFFPPLQSRSRAWAGGLGDLGQLAPSEPRPFLPWLWPRTHRADKAQCSSCRNSKMKICHVSVSRRRGRSYGCHFLSKHVFVIEYLGFFFLVGCWSLSLKPNGNGGFKSLLYH